MKIIIGNNISRLVIGGPDHLVDPNLQKNIRDYLSVDVPGAFHSPQWKKHQWDGKKYYCTPGGKVRTGMLPVLLDYLDDVYDDLEVELIDERLNPVTFKEEWETSVGDLSMDGDYDHQLRLAQAYDHYITYKDVVLPWPRGIVDAATNAGKTTIIAGIYQNAICENKRALILIHRKAIYKQLVDFMGDVFGEVGQVNDKFYEIKDVTVAMVPTLANRVKDGVVARNDIRSFPITIVDESHRSGSKQYKDVLKWSESYCRVFLSGTALDSGDIVAKLETIAHSGPKLAEVSKKELMDKNISTPVEVQVHLCNSILDHEPIDYREYLDSLVKYSGERVAIIRNIIKNTTGPTLIAVEKIEHGQFIYDNLAYLNRIDAKLSFTHGQDPNQLDKIQEFKDGEIDVLIATAILSEGVNLPKIQTIIYATGGKSRIMVKQVMGRGERLCEGKKKTVFHDFYDCGPYVAKHSEARLRVYHDEQLPVFMDFDLKMARKVKPTIIK